jgi:hypothetical protein
VNFELTILDCELEKRLFKSTNVHIPVCRSVTDFNASRGSKEE